MNRRTQRKMRNNKKSRVNRRRRMRRGGSNVELAGEFGPNPYPTLALTNSIGLTR